MATRSIVRDRTCGDAATTTFVVPLLGQGGTVNTVGVQTADSPAPGSVDVQLYVLRGIRGDLDPYGDGVLTARQPVRGSTVTEYSHNDRVRIDVTNNSGADVDVVAIVTCEVGQVATKETAKNG